MSHRVVTTALAAVAAIATTAAIAMATAGSAPTAHAAGFHVYIYNHIGRFMTAGTHSVTARCATGKKLTGGGVRQHGAGEGVVVRSSPSDDSDGWTASVKVASAPFIDMQVQVYAICGESI